MTSWPSASWCCARPRTTSHAPVKSWGQHVVLSVRPGAQVQALHAGDMLAISKLMTSLQVKLLPQHLLRHCLPVQVQFHAVALLHALRAGDRLAVSKLVAGLTKGGGLGPSGAAVRSPLAQCLLVRYVAQVSSGLCLRCAFSVPGAAWQIR